MILVKYKKLKVFKLLLILLGSLFISCTGNDHYKSTTTISNCTLLTSVNLKDTLDRFDLRLLSRRAEFNSVNLCQDINDKFQSRLLRQFQLLH